MFVSLNGSAYQNGKIMGKAARSVLTARIRAMKKTQQQKGVPDRVMKAAARDFSRLLRSVAPHWLDQNRGMAAGAGLPGTDLLLLSCLPGEMDGGGGCECTSFIEVAGSENRLFKIRDERNHVQAFYVTHPGKGRRCQVGHEIGSLGIAHFFNSAAVAGASNTGSPSRFIKDGARLDGNQVLRLMGETARAVDEIPERLERLLARDILTGSGRDRATILLFADARRGLVLEYDSHDYSARFVDKGRVVVSNHFVTRRAQAWEARPANKNTRTRRARMQDMMAAKHDRLTPLEVFAMSRDRKSLPHALCNDDSKHFWMTISAQLQVIDRDDPERSVNYMCCGNTRQSVYVPVPLVCEETFVPLLSGAFYKRADRLYRRHGCRNAARKEQTAFERAALKSNDTRKLLKGAYKLLNGLDGR